MKLIDIYLKAKHWQLFIVFFIPIIISHLISFSFLSDHIISIQNLENTKNINPEEIGLKVFELFGYIKYLLVAIALFSLIIFFWNWSVTLGLQKHIPNEHKININRFKVFFFIPLIYVVIILFIVFHLIDKLPDLINFIESGGSLSDEKIGYKILSMAKFLPLFILLHLFAVFCGFHTIYFTAKTIKLAELKRKLKFDDFIGEFFLTWFYFIGIWILQPKINDLIKDS